MITRPGGSVALVLAEAAWVSLMLDAIANGTAGSARPVVALPFVAIAPAAVLAVVLAAAVQHWVRALLVAVVAAALTAELVAGLTTGAAMFAAPSGAVAVRAMTWAAIVAVLAWGRGTWLGLAPPSELQAAISILTGWVVTIAILIRRAETHSAVYARATSDAGWLLLVFFLAGFTAVGWAHVRSLDRTVSRRNASGPGGAWLLVTGVPLAAVAGLAFLVGGSATSVVPALTGVVRDVGAGLSSVGTWVFSHFLNFSLHPRSHSIPASGGLQGALGRPTRRASVLVDVLAAVPEIIAGLGLLVVLFFLARMAVRLLRRRRRLPRPEEERTSVFSWAHLVAQARALLARLGARLGARLRDLRRRVGASGAATVETPASDRAPDADLGAVRAAYRHFLVSASAATVGREPTETPRELAGRLALDLDRGALGALTGAYERVRYGERDEADSAAIEAAEALALELSRPRRGEASPGPS